MSRQRIFLAVIGLFLILIVIYINRNLVHKYGPPLVHSNDRSSTRYFTKTNKLNTSPQLPLQGTTEGTTPPFPHSTESSSHNTKESTVPPTAADIKQSQSTTQKFKRHSGFDHGKNEKLWENVENYRVIIRRLAYYDTRGPPAIVLVALHDDRQKSKPKLFLSISYQNDDKTDCLPLEYWIKSGKLDYVMSEFYVNYMLRTKGKMRRFEKPIFVAVTTNSTCKASLTGAIPVQGTKLSSGLTYGVCLHKALFQLRNPQVVIDWIELNKELGAQFMTIYLQSVSEDIYKAVKPYVDSGFIEVLEWSLRRPLIPTGYTRDYGQSAVINECIYRNMNRVKYLGLYDVDEFMIPGPKYQKTTEILSVLEEETKSKPAAAYVFNNTYFYDSPSFVPQVKGMSLCPSMRMPLYFARTQRASNPKVYGSPKLIVKTSAVNSVQVHFVVSSQEGFLAEYGVPNDIGASHHYRSPPRMVGKTPTFYSDDVGRYAAAVLPRIKEKICKKS